MTAEATILTDRAIRERLRLAPPLIEGLRDPDTQVQPCGVDLTVRTVSRYASQGAIDFRNERRTLSQTVPLEWTENGIDLQAGAYHIVYNETVHLPPDIMALAYPRSSLLRCGATVYTAVWDPGYFGRAEALLVVHNSRGLRLHRDARVVQLVFTRIGERVDNTYSGRFHGENTEQPQGAGSEPDGG